jgi:hypothetical protein
LRFTQQEPILDVIRPIAEEICVELTGRSYSRLDTIRDARLIMDVFRKANIIRYLRMGIDPSKWVPAEELAMLREMEMRTKAA